MKNDKLIKVNSGLEKVSKQIAITNKLLLAIDPILIPYRKKDKWGFCTPDKKIVVECAYEQVELFSDDGLTKVKMNGKWGIINKNGSYLTSCVYDEIYEFYEGIALVEKNEKYGFINKNGIEIVPCTNLEAKNFSDGLAFLCTDEDTAGFIDSKGEMVFYINGDYIFDICVENGRGIFIQGLAWITFDNESGFLNKKGQEIIICKYKFAYQLSNGLVAAQKKNKKWGLLNKEGKKITSFIYDDIGEF